MVWFLKTRQSWPLYIMGATCEKGVPVHSALYINRTMEQSLWINMQTSGEYLDLVARKAMPSRLMKRGNITGKQDGSRRLPYMYQGL